LTEDIEALAKGGRTNVTGFLIRLVARIPFLIVGGQWYGPGALGRLAYAIVAVEFCAQLATLGLKRGLALHLIGEGKDKDKGVWDALLLTLLASLFPMGLMMLVPQIMFPNSQINGLDYLLPLIVPALALCEIMLAALAFRFDVKSTVRARAILEPWTISIAAFVLSWYTLRDGLLIAYALSMAVAFVASLIPFLRSYGLPWGWVPQPQRLYRLARRNLPLAAADAIEWGSRRLDIAILGLFVSPATVGIYWAAQQVASLPQKLKTSFDPVLGPVITARLQENDRPAVARQISQVGFWIIAAQTGVALTLGIVSHALMGVIGPGHTFVAGTGALVFLLLAEVAASAAVVSEAALIYIARYRNFLVSFAMIGAQVALSWLYITLIKDAGYGEPYQAAGVAGALATALLLSSLVKVQMVQSVLGARVSIWRWPLLLAVAGGAVIGYGVTWLPELPAILIGIPLVLATYGAIIWTRAFAEEDRILFRKAKPTVAEVEALTDL
jgi:O-antigen/teichoic acid export membrane protein